MLLLLFAPEWVLRILLSTHSMWFCGYTCTHTHSQKFSASIPRAQSFLASNQIEQPPQWTPQKQSGSQFAVEVVNNHQMTLAGTFLENLTPRFDTDSLGINTERSTGDKARAGGWKWQKRTNTGIEMFTHLICSHTHACTCSMSCSSSKTHAQISPHKCINAKGFCEDAATHVQKMNTLWSSHPPVTQLTHARKSRIEQYFG